MDRGTDLLIGVDAGTSVIKSVAFDRDGRQIAVASVANRYQTGGDGAAFQSLDETWRSCAQSLRDLGAQVDGLARRTAAIGLTAQGDGTWLVGAGNRPVGDAWLWLDARSAPTVRRLRSEASDLIRFERTGTGLTVCQQGAQLAHMAATAPELIAGAEVALHCKDWLYLNLTGIRATDPSEALFTFGDFRTGRYDDAVIAALGLARHRRLLPEIVDGRRTAHPLSADGAAATGLAQGTPVALGYADFACAAIGAGIYTDRSPARCTIVGSTGMHMRAMPVGDVGLNPERTGYTLALPIDGVVAQLQSNMAATLNIDWVLALAADLAAELGRPVSRPELLERMEQWAAAGRPGALLYHPYISEAGERGPFVNDRARAGFTGLNSTHRFPDLVRAVIEGLGMAARDCYAAMGLSASEIRLTGGAARSSSLRAVLAAALGAPVRMSLREEAGAAGAAMIAAVAIGAHPDMDAALAGWVTPTLGAAELPDPKLAELYARLYPAYIAARQALGPAWNAVTGGAE
jgi:erythritol kinase